MAVEIQQRNVRALLEEISDNSKFSRILAKQHQPTAMVSQSISQKLSKEPYSSPKDRLPPMSIQKKSAATIRDFLYQVAPRMSA